MIRTLPRVLRRRAALMPAGEDGSMVLALLAAIVVGGLVTVLLGTALTGQRTVRFDQRFTGAVHVAEAGVHEVIYQLNNRLIVGSDNHDPANPVSASGSGSVNGESYAWTATQIDNNTWRVVSSSTGDTTNRTVEALVADEPVYNLAAFSDVFWQSNGNNQADSYHSQLQQWCTGNGRVGTNDQIHFDGVSLGNDWCAHAYPRDKQTVDGVDLRGWEDNADPARCFHEGQGNNCYEDNDPSKEWYVHLVEERTVFDEQLEWTNEVLDLCGADLAPVSARDFPLATGSTTVRVIEPAAVGGTNPKTVQDPANEEHYVYCAETLTFDAHTRLSGASMAKPVLFAVEKQIKFALESGNRLRVNCDGCTANSLDPTNPAVYPSAPSLRIFTPASDATADPSDSVIFTNGHSRISGLILAPNGSCSGGAQAHIFGSMICGQVANEGGWNFHFDDALLDAVRTGEYSVVRWAEL
jgi:hypothetical protein